MTRTLFRPGSEFGVRDLGDDLYQMNISQPKDETVRVINAIAGKLIQQRTRNVHPRRCRAALYVLCIEPPAVSRPFGSHR
ncbi:hypothetical protein EDF72_1591 [Delftia acidovorans]|uniref:hypothetical protein n=1 Tax=Delftia acidovorans TaxID=80866 RepID=UPI000F963770|nr:hypothetical protein [Delftia acidovorans]ROR02464.1 hypothetical protein EDF72_1591 [Delftia acidovorans]